MRISDKIPHKEICQAKTTKKGHIQTTLDLLAEYKIDFGNTDRIDKDIIVDRNFTVDYASMTAEIDNQHCPKGFNCYTDGSKTKKGVGTGACLFKDDTLVDETGEPLDTHSTVFQAETCAIILACELIKEHTTCLLYTSPSPRD